MKGWSDLVNLLIVSHSRQLAEGVREFVEQVAGGLIKVGAAGGTAEGELGTSVDLIGAALEEVSTPDGVLILADLGSSVMSIQVALEMHTDLRVTISDAPLVEGAYLAAAEASAGGSLEETAAAALRACELTKVHP
jgi:dihydroxyacetone kinase phosphotransfer subunit